MSALSGQREAVCRVAALTPSVVVGGMGWSRPSGGPLYENTLAFSQEVRKFNGQFWVMVGLKSPIGLRRLYRLLIAPSYNQDLDALRHLQLIAFSGRSASWHNAAYKRGLWITIYFPSSNITLNTSRSRIFSVSSAKKNIFYIRKVIR